MRELPESIYVKGVRYDSPSKPSKVWLDNNYLNLNKSLNVKSIDHDGFNWGNHSKSAAQLALAICLQIYPQDLALEVYQPFRDEFISKIEDDGFFVTFDLTPFHKKHDIPKKLADYD